MEYSVAAILLLLFMVLISLVSVLNLLYFYISTFRSEDRGSTVVKVLRYKSESRWFDSSWCHKIFPIDSPSNRNEYQEHFLGVKAAGA